MSNFLYPYLPVHFQKPHVGSLESGFYSVSQGDNTKAYDRTSLGLTFNAARTQFDSTCWNELLDHCTTGCDDPIFRPPVASTDPASLENNFVKESLILGGLGTDDFNFKHDVVAISQDQLIFQVRS